MQDKKEHLLKVLNEAWAGLKIKPQYNDFNSKFVIDTEIMKVETLENKFPEFNTSATAVTTLSLIATISKILSNSYLAAIVEDDGTISGWTFLEGQ